MLRPPPTGISLSQDDMVGVEKQLDMYLGLLKQGFKRDDIVRYFKKHQQSNRASISQDEDFRAPSTVELAMKRPELTKGHVSTPPSHDAHYQEAERSDASEEAEDRTSPPQVASSPTPPPEVIQSHVPRRSSMLRFGQNASPIRPDDNYVRPMRTYRSRTDTYSYNQSEYSETDNHSARSAVDESKLKVTPTVRSSTMRPEAEDFIPSNSRHVPQTDRDVSPLQPTATTPIGLLDPDDPSPTSVDQDPTPSPMPRMPDSDSEDSMTLPPALPVPMPHRPLPYNLRSRDKSQTTATNTANRTPVRPSGAQLDGAPVFNVYNDTLPATVQPQTPADLARYPLLTERDAAYTAPVSTLGSPTRGVRGLMQEDSEEGVQSPTVRAIMNQGRRARELERRVRLEAGRLQRERNANGTFLDGRAAGEQQDLRRRGTTASLVDDQDESTNLAGMTGAVDWRDGLEGDRVGVENWEMEEAARGEARNPRVVSGNARRFLP